MLTQFGVVVVLPPPLLPHPCTPKAVQWFVEKTMHTNGASDASVRLSLSLCLIQCIHWSIIIDVSTQSLLLLSPPPPEVRQCMPGSAVGSVAHKTHSSKSTNGFRYEMHETDRQTYCAAFLPHRVSSIANPARPLPPLSGYATVRHLHTRCYHNQLAIFLLLSSLSLSLWFAISVARFDMRYEQQQWLEMLFLSNPLSFSAPPCFYATAD